MKFHLHADLHAATHLKVDLYTTDRTAAGTATKAALCFYI